MRFLVQLVGLALIVFGLYFLGKNILFTTNAYPYWWRGIAADSSVLFLTLGILMLTLLPLGDFKQLGWIFVGLGVLCVFISSRAVLSPTSLWEFFLSMLAMTFGYRLLATGRFSL